MKRPYGDGPKVGSLLVRLVTITDLDATTSQILAAARREWAALLRQEAVLTDKPDWTFIGGGAAVVGCARIIAQLEDEEQPARGDTHP